MLYRISVAERGLTGIANIFRSGLSRLDDLLGAGTVPLIHLVSGEAIARERHILNLTITIIKNSQKSNCFKESRGKVTETMKYYLW